MTLKDLIVPMRDDYGTEPGHVNFSRSSVQADKKLGLITDSGANSILLRSHICSFKDHFSRLALSDLGCYENRLTPNDANDLVIEARQSGIIPVMVGVFPDFYQNGYTQSDNMVCISSSVPDANFGHGIGFIGYQRHLVPHQVVQEIESFNYGCMSLGKLRSHPSIVEPVMRNTEVLYVNMNSVRKADAPGISGCLPSGLNSEEFCQLMKYAGASSQLKAVFIDLNEGSNLSESETTLIAEGIWYMMEGLNMFYNDHPSLSGDFSSFIVHHPQYDDDIEFIRNEKTSRWWIIKTGDDTNRTYLACANEEYHQSVNGEMPDRLLKFLAHE